jgi:hypothetical protein
MKMTTAKDRQPALTRMALEDQGAEDVGTVGAVNDIEGMGEKE